MKKILVYLILFISNFSSGQEKDIWYPFWNSDSTLYGFRDQNGTIKIAPKYSTIRGYIYNFEVITYVSEKVNDNWKSYYLSKNGKQFGRDSLYYFDTDMDRESEGFIRYRDPLTKNIGMFNSNGKAIIPALYNGLTNVRNGYVLGLKNARKEPWDKDGHDHSDCEHYSWVDGQRVLLDTNNQILIENFDYDEALNYYSVVISKEPILDSIRLNFLGTNGMYYSFIDYEKEFSSWIKDSLLTDLSKENLIYQAFDSIMYEDKKKQWVHESKIIFFEKNYELIKAKLTELTNPSCNFFISNLGINPLKTDSKLNNKYFNTCGEPKDWKYPIMEIVIDHKKGKKITQDYIEFIRTDEGYKLISATIRY